jgi:hypothetical protein
MTTDNRLMISATITILGLGLSIIGVIELLRWVI